MDDPSRDCDDVVENRQSGIQSLPISAAIAASLVKTDTLVRSMSVHIGNILTGEGPIGIRFHFDATELEIAAKQRKERFNLFLCRGRQG